MKAQRRKRGTAALFLQPRPRTGHFARRQRQPVRIVQEAGLPGRRSGRMRKFVPPPGIDRQTVQPLASRYTDWAIQVLRRELLPSYSEQTKCSGLKKEVAVYFKCSGRSVPNYTILRVGSSSNTDCRGQCEISDIHLDPFLGRGLLPIGSPCGFCR